MIKPASNLPTSLTIEEYLRREYELREGGSEIGYEYVAGEVYLMSPASHRHSTVIFNIMRRLHDATIAKSCRIFSDVITKVADDRYYYPDVVVTCTPLSAQGVIVSPCFVAEVTSPSTRTTDLREKPAAYRSAPSVQGILIAEQKRRHVILHSRSSTGEWSRTEHTGDGTLAIPCIDARLTLDEIYETLDLRLQVREGEEFTVEEYGREWVLVRADSVS